MSDPDFTSPSRSPSPRRHAKAALPRPSLRTIVGGAIALAVVLTTGVASGATRDAGLIRPAASTRVGEPSPLAPIRTVFLIVMENHDWSSIKGDGQAPYINKTLLPLGAHAEQYYEPPVTHGSLQNYIWLEAGDTLGIPGDGPPSRYAVSTTDHLVTLLDDAGISWRTYQEGIGGSSCPLTDDYPYAVRHNPFVYFDDVTDNGNPASSTCIAHVRPLSELARDLAHDTVARYNFITPDLCHDMHDACPPINNYIRQGDDWLSQTIPLILGSAAYRDGGAIFITWDENGHDPGTPIGLIVLSPYARRGYANSIHYSHSSTLRTIEEIFGVKPFLSWAAQANDLSDLFTVSTEPPADPPSPPATPAQPTATPPPPPTSTPLPPPTATPTPAEPNGHGGNRPLPLDWARR